MKKRKRIHCKPYYKTIKNYLVGNSSSAFYPYFNGMQYCGSLGFFEAFKIDKALKNMVNNGFIEIVAGKKDEYRIVNKERGK